jgi:serine/threonine protein kinase
MPDAVVHPSSEELLAFGKGRLAESAAAAVASHLEACTACQELVSRAGPDSFVRKLRAARPASSSPSPSRSLLPSGGASSVPADDAPPPNCPPELANHPKYRIIRELGRGGMGVVYQAVQTLMDRTVAVKVINPSVLEHRDALARFQAEVKAAAKLDHANIVRAYDADQVGGLHLLVMEFVQGMSLADLVSHKGPLPIAHACHFIRQGALGLQHAFEQGMVHRDIKPQNLMVTPRGQVKILDFGLARLRSESGKGGGLTDVGAFMGTPEYVSPEQATDARTADTRADLYSLGCTLYFLLTGRPPFQEETVVKMVLAQIEKEAPPVQELRADVPAELSAVVARLLAKDPAQRYQTPIELAQALVPLIKAGAKPSTPAPAESRPPVASSAAGTLMGGDTSKMPEARKEQADKRAAPAAPAPEKGERFKDPAVAPASPKNVQKGEIAASPGPAPWLRHWRARAGGGLAVLILGLIGLWAAALNVKTPQGTIILENIPADAELTVEGPTVTMRRNGEFAAVSAVSEGPYRLKVVVGGQEIWSSGEVRVKIGGDPIRLQVEPPVEFRNIEIKELPPAKPDSAAVSSDRGNESPDPYADEIKRDKETYEAAIKRADETLLAAFDRALEALATANMKAEERLKLIAAVKAEKDAFDKKGRIPWSAPMRGAMLEYTKAVSAHRETVSRSFEQAMGFFAKRMDVGKGKEYLAEKRRVLQPKVVAVWSYTWWPGKTARVEFRSDGTTAGHGTTWSVDKHWVTIKGPNGRFRGGYHIDKCKTCADGKTMSGANQVGHAKSAKLLEE